MNAFEEAIQRRRLAREKLLQETSSSVNYGYGPRLFSAAETPPPSSSLLSEGISPLGVDLPSLEQISLQGMAELGQTPQPPLPTYTRSAFLKAIKPAVVGFMGLAKQTPGAAQFVEILKERDPEFAKYIQPRNAAEAFTKWIGEAIGIVKTAGLGARATGAFKLGKLAPVGATFRQRLTARIPFTVGETAALTANDIASAAVSEDRDSGDLIKQIPVNFAVGLGGEAVLTKLIKSHGRELGKRTVSYKLDTSKDWLFDALKKDMEVAGYDLADIAKVDLQKLAAQEYVAISYPESAASKEIQEAVKEKFAIIQQASRGIYKGLEAVSTRLRDSLYNNSTPEENVPLLRAIGEAIAGLGLNTRRNIVTMKAVFRQGLTKFANDFTLPNGELDTDLLAKVPQSIKSGIPSDNPKVLAFVDWIQSATRGIAEDARALGMRVWDPIKGALVEFVPQEKYWPNLHNFTELGKIIQKALPDTPEWELKQSFEKIFNEVTSEQTTFRNMSSTLLNYLIAKQEQNKVKWLRTTYNIPGGSYNPFEVLPQYFDEMVEAVENFRSFDQLISVSGLGEKLGSLALHVNPMQINGPSVTEMLQIGQKVVAEGNTISFRNAIRNAVKNLGGDTRMLDNLMDAITGRLPTKGLEWERPVSLIRTLMTVKWLPWSGVTQMDSMVNIMARFNIGQSLRGLYETFAKGGPETLGMSGVEWAKATGSAVNDLAYILDSIYPTRETSRFLRTIGATWVDRGLRHWASNTAKLFWQDMVKKGATEGIESFKPEELRSLLKLRLNLEKAIEYYDNTKTFDPDELIRAGYEGHVQTQLVSDILESPIFMQHPLGRLIMTQRTYQYQMARFINDNIIAELKQGNLKPLLSYLTSASLVGEVKLDLSDAIRLKDPTQRGYDPNIFQPDLGEPLRDAGIPLAKGSRGEWLINRVVGNVLNGVGLGLWLDVAQSALALYRGDLTALADATIGVPYRTMIWGVQGIRAVAPEALSFMQNIIDPSMTVTREPSEKAPVLPKIADIATTALVASGAPGVSQAATVARMALPAASAAFAPTPTQLAQLPSFLKTPAGAFSSELTKANYDKRQFDERINKALDKGNLSRAMQQQAALNEWMLRRYVPTLLRAGSQAGLSPGEVSAVSQSLVVSPEDLSERIRSRFRSRLKKERLSEQTFPQSSWRLIERAHIEH